MNLSGTQMDIWFQIQRKSFEVQIVGTIKGLTKLAPS